MPRGRPPRPEQFPILQRLGVGRVQGILADAGLVPPSLKRIQADWRQRGIPPAAQLAIVWWCLANGTAVSPGDFVLTAARPAPDSLPG